MRNTDFTKPQNKKLLALMERADKLAGPSSVQDNSLGNAHAGIGAVAPSGNAPASAAGTAGEGIGFNDRQKREAFLVSQLPNDFPIDGWENLSTKQQLHAMKYSGLNDQEQWELLNPSTSLKALASYNAQKADVINNAVNSSAIRNSGAFGLNFEAAKNSQNPSNPSKLPSLQRMDSDARMRIRDVAGNLAAKILGMDRPAPTPSPTPTPLPQPGPRIPTQTPRPVSEPTPYKSPEAKPLPYPPGVIPTVETHNWYDSYDKAAEAWAKENVNLSKDLERCAMIYRNIDKNGNERYTFTKSYYGMDEIPFLGIRPNVVIPFAWLRYFASGIPESDIVGFIHSHPEPPEGASYKSASDEDLSLNKYGIENVTVVPYETGVPQTYNLPDVD